MGIAFLLSLHHVYKKFSFYRNKFFSYRYFIRNYDKVREVYVDNAKRKVIYNEKECYFPREIPKNFRVLKRNYFWDGKRRHLVELSRRYSKSYNNNTIYIIPLADMAISKKQNKIFGFDREELNNKAIVIEVNSNDSIVLAEPGKALYYSFSGSIKPTSFRVTDHKTGETRWIPSLIMLPFNLAGSTCSFTSGLAGGILNKIGDIFLLLSKRIPIFPFRMRPISERTSFLRKLIPIKYGWIYISISEGLDDKIDANRNGVLVLSKRLLKTSPILVCIFESLAALFIAANSVVECVGYTADALLRTPNFIFHHDDLNRKATWANIKSSTIDTYLDLSRIGKDAISSFQACKARLNGKIEKLQQEEMSDNADKDTDRKEDTDNKINKQNEILNNLSNVNQSKIREASRELRDIKKSIIIVGAGKRLSNSCHIASEKSFTNSF